MKKSFFFFLIGVSFLSYSQNTKHKQGKIYLPSNRSECRISFTNIGSNKIAYSIYNNPVSHNYALETKFNIRVNGEILDYNNKPLIIYPRGRPLVEGDNIELLRVKGQIKHDAHISYSLIKNFDINRDSIFTGFFSFTSSNGPTLLTNLKKPRTIRIHLDEFQPKISNSINYEFEVIVDGEKVRNGILTNGSSMDVHGSQVIIELKSWPTTTSGFRILGSFELLL